MNLESPCAPTASRTQSKTPRLVSKAAAWSRACRCQASKQQQHNRESRTTKRQKCIWMRSSFPPQLCLLLRACTHACTLIAINNREASSSLCAGEGMVWGQPRRAISAALSLPVGLHPFAFGSFSSGACGLPPPSSHPAVGHGTRGDVGYSEVPPPACQEAPGRASKTG